MVAAVMAGISAMAAVGALGQAHPRDGQIHDADTRSWWHMTEALSGDDMEGRDTGTAAYQRAAEVVAGRFKAAGLEPAGEAGSYFQSVPMHAIDTLPEGTSFVVTRDGGAEASGEVKLEFLQEITATWTPESLREGAGALTFRGYCGKDAMKDVEGKIVVCFGTQRQGLPTGAERVANARNAGARGIVNVDDPYFTIEPPRWPYAYARSVTLKETGTARAPRESQMLPPMRLSAAAFAKLLAGSGHDAAAVLKAGGAKEPLESFAIPGTMRVKLAAAEKEIASPNVLGMLPGTDPALKEQVVVIAAHLDGYGYGTPVAGDGLYNGALDDAAYVALLIQFAEDLQHEHKALKRSVLFCAFTGEEKGLLGSSWFVEHPTVPVARMAADINLDQLRPLFPLKILTAEAVDDTTLGTTARSVGAAMGVEIREDHEPERGLLRRADQYPFLRIHVPAISFIFGYDAGTDAERRYREWYQVRYHRPQDDLTQPMDFAAAAKFDRFFYTLTETVANAAERPSFVAGSPLAAKP
jgi:hypothetical protein